MNEMRMAGLLARPKCLLKLENGLYFQRLSSRAKRPALRIRFVNKAQFALPNSIGLRSMLHKRHDH